MVKKIYNVAILCLFVANLSLAVHFGFHPLSIAALALAGIVILWNVIAAIKAQKKRK